MSDAWQGVLAGMTGSGKSQRVRQLLEADPHPRVVALDPLGDDYPDMAAAPDFARFAEAWRDLHYADRFQVRQTSPRHEDQLRTLELINRTQQEGKARPLLVVMEEASRFSRTGSIPEPVQRTITEGRHHRISVISVSQRTAQVHSDVQQSARTLVLFRSMKPAGWVRDLVPDATERLRELEAYTAEDYEADRPVERGVHYITYPPETDLEEQLRRVAP